MKRVAVFASGSGSNFQSIADAISSGRTPHLSLCGLIASKPGIQAMERAQLLDLPAVSIVKSDFSDDVEFGKALLEQVGDWDTDIIALAGFLVKLPPSFIAQFSGIIVNIHPSLLPKFGGYGFYGQKVHAAVLEAGETITGCTVHFVDEGYDTGKILAQKTLLIHPGETVVELAARVLKAEHELYPEVLERLARE